MLAGQAPDRVFSIVSWMLDMIRVTHTYNILPDKTASEKRAIMKANTSPS